MNNRLIPIIISRERLENNRDAACMMVKSDLIVLERNPVFYSDMSMITLREFGNSHGNVRDVRVK